MWLQFFTRSGVGLGLGVVLVEVWLVVDSVVVDSVVVEDVVVGAVYAGLTLLNVNPG